MIGLNGGLIGKDNTPNQEYSLPGMWTLDEQIKARYTNIWPSTALLLDAFPSPLAAYSLRSLSTSATNVVRVRRSSGAPSEENFTAVQVANGELETWVGAGNNGFVTTWYDQSGNGNNATQATTANQPQIVTSGSVNLTNGKPCLVYNNSGSTSLTLATRLTTILSVFQVLNIASSQLSGGGKYLLGDSSEYNYHGGDSGTWLSSQYASSKVQNGTNRINKTITNLMTTSRTSNQVLISMIHTGNAIASRICQDRGLTTNSIRGTVQEVVLYSTSQFANFNGIAANINAYYNIYAF